MKMTLNLSVSNIRKKNQQSAKIFFEQISYFIRPCLPSGFHPCSEGCGSPRQTHAPCSWWHRRKYSFPVTVYSSCLPVSLLGWLMKLSTTSALASLSLINTKHRKWNQVNTWINKRKKVIVKKQQKFHICHKNEKFFGFFWRGGQGAGLEGGGGSIQMQLSVVFLPDTMILLCSNDQDSEL